MTTVQDDNPAPAVRFKRRKLAHAKRVYADSDAHSVSESQTPNIEASIDVPLPPKDARDEDDSVPNLKEILRNRRRPRDRMKDVARMTQAPKTEPVAVEASREGHYTSRFVAQTGQVVDRDDKQM